ncbi:MAG: ATPase [Paracoccaceae bacterium]
MLYNSADEWRAAPRKQVLFFGMSGLGKTHVSNILRSDGSWFHYSIDYRIGTRYMGEYIIDNAKAEAMKVPFLRDLLLSDSIYIGSNISFENLKPVAAYLSAPGSEDKGGIDIDEYRRRQDQFRHAEIHALLDTDYFIDRAERLYGYPNFICDTGGSICEWVDPENPDDLILKTLSDSTLMVWLKGNEEHTQELIRRFDRDPKPMSYMPEFLTEMWQAFLNENNAQPDEVDPAQFLRFTYARALAHRQPRYEAMAKWGITVPANQMARVRSPADFDDVIAEALAARTETPT